MWNTPLPPLSHPTRPTLLWMLTICADFRSNESWTMRSRTKREIVVVERKVESSLREGSGDRFVLENEALAHGAVVVVLRDHSRLHGPHTKKSSWGGRRSREADSFKYAAGVQPMIAQCPIVYWIPAERLSDQCGVGNGTAMDILKRSIIVVLRGHSCYKRITAVKVYGILRLRKNTRIHMAKMWQQSCSRETPSIKMIQHSCGRNISQRKLKFLPNQWTIVSSRWRTSDWKWHWEQFQGFSLHQESRRQAPDVWNRREWLWETCYNRKAKERRWKAFEMTRANEHNTSWPHFLKNFPISLTQTQTC